MPIVRLGTTAFTIMLALAELAAALRRGARPLGGTSGAGARDRGRRAQASEVSNPLPSSGESDELGIRPPPNIVVGRPEP
jgi:hypothetical protein